jgi:xanthine dehydrogenase large subunit
MSTSPNLLHVTGAARFIDDEPAPSGMLRIKVLTSPHAHARIADIRTAAAAALPGVAAVLTWADIPGLNRIGHIRHDEPLLPGKIVSYVGQPVVVVAAENEAIARAALALIEIDYAPLPAVLGAAQAVARQQFFAPAKTIVRGDVHAALASCAHVLEGEVRSGGQEHFYLETQICRAIPGEGQSMTLFSATQSTAEIQEIAARILGLSSHDITVDVPRLGGAFGGKERGATIWACLTALACRVTGRPVELRLSRTEDMAWTGKRHPFAGRYRVGFDATGRILAHELTLIADGGAFLDLSLPILERAMLHADNAYFLPAAHITGLVCRTNTPPNTAFRGFGAPQGIFTMEHVMERIARHLGLDPFEIRRRNCYQEGQTTPYGQPVRDAHGAELLNRLEASADHSRLRREADAFNAAHPTLRRGLGVVPVKFGISFTTTFLNQGSALIWILRDGSISLSHGGVEMGQAVNTKVALVVAGELGVSMERIRVETANTSRIANASPTAASTGSDLNGLAAQNAAQTLVARLRPVAARLLREAGSSDIRPEYVVFAHDQAHDIRHPEQNVPFADVAAAAHAERVDLGAHGFAAPEGIFYDPVAGQGHPFVYFVQGCALVLAEVDLVSGQSRAVAVHIVHETGHSLHPDIDRGQIMGAFFQGLGWVTMEELLRDECGRCLTVTPSTYKIPGFRDLPESVAIDLVERTCAAASVKGSKAVGEPPLIYGEAAYFAILNALESVAGRAVDLPCPATPEAVLLALEQARPGNRAGHE